jgi:hypothetical protein
VLYGKDVYRHFANVKRRAALDYGLAGSFRRSFLFVAPFPSHKWITDEEKARHYKSLKGLLRDGALLTRTESVRVRD